MKHVLVTGGAGFIGSALVRGLLRTEGVQRVVVVDNLLTGNPHNLDEVQSEIDFQHVDIRDLPAIQRVFQNIDVVFHEAAIPSVPRSINEPSFTHDVNVNGTLNVFIAAHSAGVRRVVYAASSSAYGDTEVLPKVETLPPKPKSPYAVQKLMGEYYAKTFFDNYGLETVCLRYFNVFGPRQDPESPYSGVIALFCRSVLEGRAPTIYDDGQQTRDFTYVDNIVDLNIRAALTPGVAGNIYNGGTGQHATINQTWEIVQRIQGKDLPPAYSPARRGDIRDSLADISAARRDLGYDPLVPVELGLRRTLHWYRESPFAPTVARTLLAPEKP